MVSSDYRQYSPYEYFNNTKKSENWSNQKQNLIIFDVDSGLTLEDAMKKFADYRYFICTTKSHQKEKKGVIADRFRIFLQSDNIPKGDDYFLFMREIEKIFPFIDVQVNTKTGAFLGFKQCQYFYNEGKKLNCDVFMKMAIKTKEHKKQAETQFKSKTHQKSYDDITDIDKIKSKLNRELVSDIISSLGFQVGRDYKFKMRDEKTPSASIKNDGLIKDFGSDFSGDVIDFIMEVKSVSFKEAVEIVSEWI
jgi:hypothetical protein